MTPDHPMWFAWVRMVETLRLLADSPIWEWVWRVYIPAGGAP